MANVVVFGPVEAKVFEQIRNCQAPEPDAPAVLCADNHLGYSMPIGGVIGYRDHISPSAVGYDIGCGNMAARTAIRFADAKADLSRLMDEVWAQLSFGVGRKNTERVDHPVLEAIDKDPDASGLYAKACDQLGTIGSGNHYVDLLVDERDFLWVGVHFGSRGFGHSIATWALQQAQATSNDMMAPPALLGLNTHTAEAYIRMMHIAGDYAYAGREWVVRKVLRDILQTPSTFEVHNHHNYAWREEHGGEDLWVHRKGATPAFPDQYGFIGGSMGDMAVIVRGVDSPMSAQALYSTVHGAGRVMSRTQAAGKFKKGIQVRPGAIDWLTVQAELKAQGVELRGAGADEAPGAYKRLPEVLAHHVGTIEIVHRLQPVGVAMAGKNEFDPYKD